MERINKLLQHTDFIENLNRLNTLEADRIYCRHGLPHLLDVARIACILQYRENASDDTVSFPDEIIYAAALLHDMGRVLQYEQGLPHETAGLCLAGQILQDCGFTKSEQVLIIDAIQFHRTDYTEYAGTDHANQDHARFADLNKGHARFADLNKGHARFADLTRKGTPAQGLRSLLHDADKLSRNCFACAASNSCYWPEAQKNKGILC